MLLRILLRKETLLLAGVTAALTVPLFRSGELTFGKLAHWAIHGIASAPATPPSPSGQSYGIWNPDLGNASAPPDLIPASTPNQSYLGQILHSMLETQVVNDPAAPPSETALPGSDSRNQTRTATSDTLPTTPTPQTSPATVPGARDNPLANWIPIQDLREVIRFDVSPYWVQQRWQPATQLALDQDGYVGWRVALVTDHRVGLLHGALTFYFDAEATVQRIQFQGTALDITPLEKLLSDHFRFVDVPDRERLRAPIHQNVARGMFRYSEPIVATSRPNTQLREVAFEINSTQGKYQLSQPYRQLAIQ